MGENIIFRKRRIQNYIEAYYNHVFGQRKHPEYLTEKQLEIGPIAIDLDFRYNEDKRHYTNEHIIEFIELLNAVFG